ncbi:MAG: hypothetical protein CSA97_00610 [Bacteroidetes bacterium]|nr:MAG: hypothetical protein CSA97_00610 [Bacteroidota bacterium]
MVRRTELQCLYDMIYSIGLLKEYTAGKQRADMEQHIGLQDMVCYRLQILGEAAKGVGEELKAQYDNIPWREMCGLRDILAHDYFGLDFDIIWDVVEHRLPPLMEQLKDIYSEQKRIENE